ncbi:LPS export ABC transporter permease LptF [Escherichia coli]|nr:LPS export ABC transporter permease LptF [Escherichia coli]MEB3582044.1 LPS export ABC transporter permease LptF [Escherichia coli]
MSSRLIIALIIMLLAQGVQAHNFVTGKTVTPVYIQEGGELLLNSDDEIHYQKWNSTQLAGKVRIIQYIAGRKSAKKKNSLLIKAVEAANFPQDRFQPTTIVNTDDAIFGTGYFVVGKIEKNKRRYPWAQFVIDGNGLGRVAWRLPEQSSTILVLIIVGFLIFIFASYSAQRYLTEAANGTLALDVVLDIVFYKVLIALEMLLPVGLYVSVGVTLGQMYTDSEITAISAAGGNPGRLYKAVLYLAIPLSIFVTLLSMYGRPWAYAQIYQLEQQSQSELDVRQLRAKKFNTNDNGRMILSQTVDQDNNRLTDALIYTSTANRTRIFRARSVDVVDPSPEKPTVMLHNGTAYLLDHQGRDDNEQIYRNLQLHLNPLDQSPNVKRKAKSVTELARSAFPADHAELQWRQSRGLTALLMALLAISLSRVKPRQGRFSTLLPLTLLFVAIFYGGDVCGTLVANGAIPLIPGLWLVPGLMLMGLLMLVARDFSLLQKFSR